MQSKQNEREHAARPEGSERCEEPVRTGCSRRDLFPGLGLGRGAAAAGAAGVAGVALAGRAVAEQGFNLNPAFMVQVFLRGGADGLSLLCPYNDPGYAANRNETRLYAPGTTMQPPERYVIPLSGSISGTTFGIPQALQPLEQIYDDNKLAFVHAVGNVGGPQSHFAAQDIMEQGANAQIALPGTGWIARHLELKTNHLLGVDRKFRAMGYRAIQMVSLFGTPVATPVADPETYALPDFLGVGASRSSALESVYSGFGPPMDDAFATTDEAISVLDGVDFGIGPTYPATQFGLQMHHAARIAKKTDVEVVTIDVGGWDTHKDQGVYAGGPTGAAMHGRMEELAGALRAFYDEMSNQSRGWIVVVVTEFGRKVPENANAGTDHGKGGVAMVMGNAVNGGQLYGTWPGLGATELDDLDLAVTTDMRDVLEEVADKALVNQASAQIFRSVDSTYTKSQLGLL